MTTAVKSDQEIAARIAHDHLSEARVHLRIAMSLIEDPVMRGEIQKLLANDLDKWRWKTEMAVREAQAQS